MDDGFNAIARLQAKAVSSLRNYSELEWNKQLYFLSPSRESVTVCIAYDLTYIFKVIPI